MNARTLRQAGILAALALAVTGIAVAQTTTTRAKVLIKDGGGAGVNRGVVYITETVAGGRFVDHKISFSGSVTAPNGTYAVHLWQGTCDELLGHVDLSSQYHPLHTGDLPNITASSGVARFSAAAFQNVTNRFTLTSGPLNLWGTSFAFTPQPSEPVSLALTPGNPTGADGQGDDDDDDDGTSGDPDSEGTPVAFCGEVVCDSPNCFQGGSPE